MAGSPITISSSSVPNDYCAQGIQQDWPFLVGLLAAELTGNVGTFNDGDSTPSPDNQDKAWMPSTFSGSNPPAFVYRFVNGAWIMPHPVAPGIISLYLGTDASIPTFDGGEAGTVSDTTGPMWERVAAFDARFPVGVGTFPSGTAVAVTGTGGEEKHELLMTEIPNHDHGVGGKNLLSVNATSKTVDLEFGGADAGGIQAVAEGGDSSNGDATVAHNNLPPLIGVFFIRRTARRFYRR